MIFISHSESCSDREIAGLLVDFLLEALSLEPEDIRCPSVIGHQFPLGVSIGEQLRKDLNTTDSLIALITRDSLRSSWVLFHLCSAWTTQKLFVPILGPGLNSQNLPGPLTSYEGVRIDDEQAFYRLTDAINQLASTLNVQQKISSKRDERLNQFLNGFRSQSSLDKGQDLDIANYQKSVRVISSKYQALEIWKGLHEELQKFCANELIYFRLRIDSFSWIYDYAEIFRLVTGKLVNDKFSENPTSETGEWEKRRNRAIDILNRFDEKFVKHTEEIPIEQRDYKKWSKKKLEEYRSQSRKLRNSINQIDGEIAQWIKPENVEHSLPIFRDYFNDFDRDINKYLTAVDDNLKYLIQEFEQDIENLKCCLGSSAWQSEGDK